MGASQTRSVYKTLADHVIGRASLANVERALKKATSLFGSLTMGRADAMAPVMAFTQSLELLSIEFHVHLVPARSAQRVRCPNSTPWRAGCLLDAESDRADDAGANANHRLNSIPQEYDAPAPSNVTKL